MASLTGNSSPYDVLNPGMDDSTTDDSSTTSDASTDDTGSSDADSSTDESADDESTSDDSDGADAAEGDDSSAEEGDPDHAAADAKAVDTQWKANKEGNLPQAMKDIISANPAHAARLKEMYFTNQRLMKLGTPSEIRRMKETVDAVGGPEKLAELQTQIAQMGGEQGFQEAISDLNAWGEVDQLWQNDQAQLANHLAESNPAAFEKLAPIAFQKLGDINPELYDNVASSIIMNTISASGTLMDLRLMGQALAAGDAKLAGEYYGKVQAVLNNLSKLATAAPKSKTADPRAQALSDREKAFGEQQLQTFQQGFIVTLKSQQDPKINGELTAYLGANAPKNNSRLTQAIKEEVWNSHLRDNAPFQKSRAALLAKMDGEGLKRLYAQYIPDKVWQKVTRDICAEFNLRPAGKKQGVAPSGTGTKTTATAAAAGWSKITKYPDPEQVDREKTTQDMIIKDQFIMKDGRKLQYVGPK